ncbi:MAG: Uma2 family endonuclease [Aggregatilineales bacterium]
MPQPEVTTMTEAEYLAFDAENDFKSEYAGGQIYMMAGASNTHIDITGNIFGYLFSQLLNSSCRIAQSEMRIQIKKKSKTAYRYPDVVVVCGERNLVKDMKLATLTNPTVLFEVLSPSTASIDRVQKLDEYQQIPSVQDYLIIAQQEARVLRFQRQSERLWLNITYTELDEAIELTSIGCTLKLSDIYRRVEFEPEDDDS